MEFPADCACIHGPCLSVKAQPQRAAAAAVFPAAAVREKGRGWRSRASACVRLRCAALCAPLPPSLPPAADLTARGLDLGSAVFVHLYLASMGHFGAANSVYCSYFPSLDPPSRACVQVRALTQHRMPATIRHHHAPSHHTLPPEQLPAEQRAEVPCAIHSLAHSPPNHACTIARPARCADLLCAVWAAACCAACMQLPLPPDCPVMMELLLAHGSSRVAPAAAFCGASASSAPHQEQPPTAPADSAAASGVHAAPHGTDAGSPASVGAGEGAGTAAAADTSPLLPPRASLAGCSRGSLEEDGPKRRDGSPVALAPRSVLHVQSISEWAPSCIGPYSQVGQGRGGEGRGRQGRGWRGNMHHTV